MRKNLFKLTLVMMLCMSLTACGFHLRGEKVLPPQLKTLYIDAAPYSPFTLALKQIMKSDGVKIVDSAAESPVTLQILSENFNQSLNNVSSSTLVKTYRVTYTVAFQLLTKNKTVLYGPKTIKTMTTFFSNDNQILGDNEQLDNQKEDLRREAIGLLFNRLGSQDVRKALAKR